MKLTQILVAFCILCLFLPGAAAIGLSHNNWENPILYVPGEEYTFYFVVSEYGYDASISVEDAVGDDWAEYVTLSEITSPSPGKKEFTVTISPPREPDTPGLHSVYIGAGEVASPTGTVGAIARVRKQISFKVLFPYKFLTAELMAPDVNIGEPVHFQLMVTSGTLQTIRSVRGTIEITDAAGALLATIPTDSVTLGLGERKVLTGTLSTAGIKPATYYAKATVIYDGNETTAEDSFRVGTLAVHIINHTTQVEAGTITPFIIQVESGWNDPIENVYGEVYVDQQPVMKTPTTTLAPWEEQNLTGYFDAAGWEPSEHNSTVIVHFGDKSTLKMGKLIVTERRGAGGGWLALGWTHLLIAGIVLLIVILTANIFILTRQRDNKDSRKKNQKKK